VGRVFCPACRSDYPADWKVCPKDATNLLRSPQIAKYVVDGLLGQGGMGAVYRAMNPDTKGRVAIKVMNPAVANAESARQRFQREAAAVAALRTAHVVKVFDFGSEPDGTLYLVMELLDGHPLRDEIKPGSERMDLSRVQMVMDGALKGLAAAHKAGIVHRDLKPENIVIADTDDGEVPKLLDFGIARVRSPDSSLTRTGSVMGTASYMAPEQVAGNLGEIGPWTDIYAMGAILYEMLGGTPAYGGTTVTEVLQHVLRSEHTALQQLRPDLSEAVYALVDRCMSQQPVQRPQDAEAMRIAVTAARLVPHGATIVPRGTAQTEIPSAPSGTAPPSGVALTEGAVISVREATRPPAAPPSSVREPAEPLEHRPRGPRIGLVIAALAVVAAIVIGVIATRSGDHAASSSDAAIAMTADATAPADAATVAVVDAHVADARLATVADARPAPPDARVVAQAIDAGGAVVDAAHGPDCSHVEELVSKARQLAGENSWVEALPVAEAVVACRPNNPNMHRIITIAACIAGNKALAQAHWTQLVGKGRNLARETCQQHGITLE